MKTKYIYVIVTAFLCTGCFSSVFMQSDNYGKIAFISDRGGKSQIFVMNADGSNVQRLTDNPADDWDPVWSPDGEKIAFIVGRYGTEEIYVMNADGTNQANITNNPHRDV